MTRRNALDCSDFIGIPYRDPASPGGQGMHCWELVEAAMLKLFDLQPPPVEFTGTYKEAAPAFMTRLRYWMHVNFTSRQAGDLIVLRVGGQPSHCGILINRDQMLHTMAGHNSCLESVIGSRWESRIYGVYRWLA